MRLIPMLQRMRIISIVISVVLLVKLSGLPALGQEPVRPTVESSRPMVTSIPRSTLAPEPTQNKPNGEDGDEQPEEFQTVTPVSMEDSEVRTKETALVPTPHSLPRTGSSSTPMLFSIILGLIVCGTGAYLWWTARRIL
jgi:hypothetical protein